MSFTPQKKKKLKKFTWIHEKSMPSKKPRLNALFILETKQTWMHITVGYGMFDMVKFPVLWFHPVGYVLASSNLPIQSGYGEISFGKKSHVDGRFYL